MQGNARMNDTHLPLKLRKRISNKKEEKQNVNDKKGAQDRNLQSYTGTHKLARLA